MDTDSPQHVLLLQKLAALEEALLASDPSMPQHLGEIHRLLISHEELVHLLKDEEIGKIMSAQQKHTDTVLLGSIKESSGKAAANKKAAKISIEDL